MKSDNEAPGHQSTKKPSKRLVANEEDKLEDKDKEEKVRSGKNKKRLSVDLTLDQVPSDTEDGGFEIASEDDGLMAGVLGAKLGCIQLDPVLLPPTPADLLTKTVDPDFIETLASNIIEHHGAFDAQSLLLHWERTPLSGVLHCSFV